MKCSNDNNQQHNQMAEKILYANIQNEKKNEKKKKKME